MLLAVAPPALFCALSRSRCASQVSGAPDRPHLVSIGDSEFERNAAHHAAKACSAASVKTVKLIDPWEGPTIAELRTQLQQLTESLQEISARETSVDLETDVVGSSCRCVECTSGPMCTDGAQVNPSARGEQRAA